jgi:putative transcriptional regulator
VTCHDYGTVVNEEKKVLKKIMNNGYVLLALAALLLWVGNQVREPLPLHHKILVANPSMKQDVFEHAVILVINHNMTGAFGLILNKSSGGPVEPDRIFALHSTDVMLPESIVMGDVNLGFLDGAESIDSLKALDIKPAWYIIAHGYAGWLPGQLDREVRRGVWKIIDYDSTLLEMDSKIMWQEATKRPNSHI